MVMEPSLTMAKLSGKLDELKDVMDVTCNRGMGLSLRSGIRRGGANGGTEQEALSVIGPWSGQHG